MAFCSTVVLLQYTDITHTVLRIYKDHMVQHQFTLPKYSAKYSVKSFSLLYYWFWEKAQADPSFKLIL